MKYIILSGIFMFFAHYTFSQEDFTGKLASVENAYSSGDLPDARFQLQQALIDLDRIIGHKVLELLPTEVDGKSYIESQDEVLVQGVGTTGLTIIRSYGLADTVSQNIDFSLVNHSPMLQALNAFIANPMFMGAMGGGKMIKINGYKAVLEKSESDTGEVKSITVQIPFGDSLLIYGFDGYSDENKVIAHIEEFDMDAIIQVVGQN